MGVAGVRNFTVNFGPQHSAVHGVLHLVLELNGEWLNGSVRTSGFLSFPKILSGRIGDAARPRSDLPF
jgi:hypothetical protein